MEQRTYIVEGMTCDHCVGAVRSEVGGISGITEVDVDLDTKLVTVSGTDIDDAAVFAAVEEAGFEAVSRADGLMAVPVRLGLFAAALVAAFAVAFGVGTAMEVDPEGSPAPSEDHQADDHDMGSSGGHDEGGG